MKPDEFNFSLINEHWDESLEKILFGDEHVNHIQASAVPKNIDMFDILVMLDFFDSKSTAKKHWKRSNSTPPPGFNDWKIGKRKRRITFWVPKPTIDTP